MDLAPEESTAIASSFLFDNAPVQISVFCQYSRLHTPGKQPSMINIRRDRRRAI